MKERKETTPRGEAWQRWIAIGTWIAYLAGCTSGVPGSVRAFDPATKPRPRVLSISVATAAFKPEIEVAPVLAKDTAAEPTNGAARGAVAGAKMWLKGGSGLSCGGDLCGVVALLYVATLPIFVVGGAVAGAAKGSPETEAEAEAGGKVTLPQLPVSEMLLPDAIQSSVAVQLSRAGFPSVDTLVDEAAPHSVNEPSRYQASQSDAVLEVAILSIDIDEIAHFNPSLVRPIVTVRGRLLRPASGELLDEVLFPWRGPPTWLEQWLRDDGQYFVAVLEAAIPVIAEALTYELLLAWYPPRGVALPGRDNGRVPAFVLQPVDLPEPAPPAHFAALPAIPLAYVESQQPRLAWETFPRGFDGLNGTRLGKVRYDFRLYHVSSGKRLWWAAPVEEGLGLTEAEYRPATPLEACGRYRWTVRARFELDGQPRATEWSYRIDPGGEGTIMEPWQVRRGLSPISMLRQDVPMQLMFHPFRVPKEDGSHDCPAPPGLPYPLNPAP